MPRCIDDWNMGQLLARFNTPQHKTTATHIATTDEFCGKQ